MTENEMDVIEIDRETLENLRAFTCAHIAEYGHSVDIFHAVIDSGIALGMDDPTPPLNFSSIDPEAKRLHHGDEAVDHLRERWGRYKETNQTTHD